MMRKHKSVLLLGLLFGASWAATSIAKTEVYVWVSAMRMEGPTFLLGQDTKAPMVLLIALALVFWLQRDKLGRTLATLGAVGALLFCMESAQIILRNGGLLYGGSFNSQPAFALVPIHQELWSQIIYADVAFALSALCLWLCVRAAGPKQPRPLASWRDWLSWNGVRTAHSEESLDVFPSP